MDLEGFKRIYFVEWLHRMVGRTIGILYAGPMAYFWARGYFQRRMKIVTTGVLGLYATQG